MIQTSQAVYFACPRAMTASQLVSGNQVYIHSGYTWFKILFVFLNKSAPTYLAIRGDTILSGAANTEFKDLIASEFPGGTGYNFLQSMTSSIISRSDENLSYTALKMVGIKIGLSLPSCPVKPVSGSISTFKQTVAPRQFFAPTTYSSQFSAPITYDHEIIYDVLWAQNTLGTESYMETSSDLNTLIKSHFWDGTSGLYVFEPNSLISSIQPSYNCACGDSSILSRYNCKLSGSYVSTNS